MIVTIIIPISREQFLDQIFARLELMDCNPEETNILGIVDGDQALFVKARNLIQNSRFKERLCTQFRSPYKLRHFDTLGRRLRISDIHNQAKGYLTSGTDLVLLTEDDSLLPANCLKKLLYDFTIWPHAGFIQGAQVGRHGISHIGAFRALPDVYEPTTIESLLPPEDKTTIESIDSGGFYAALMKADTYVNHEHKPFDNNSLGPDATLGFETRRSGYQNYIDWSIPITHLTKSRQITPSNTPLQKVTFTKNDRGTWRQHVENI